MTNAFDKFERFGTKSAERRSFILN